MYIVIYVSMYLCIHVFISWAGTFVLTFGFTWMQVRALGDRMHGRGLSMRRLFCLLALLVRRGGASEGGGGQGLRRPLTRLEKRVMTEAVSRAFKLELRRRWRAMVCQGGGMMCVCMCINIK